jgi:hypothetical protein
MAGHFAILDRPIRKRLVCLRTAPVQETER